MVGHPGGQEAGDLLEQEEHRSQEGAWRTVGGGAGGLEVEQGGGGAEGVGQPDSEDVQGRRIWTTQFQYSIFKPKFFVSIYIFYLGGEGLVRHL